MKKTYLIIALLILSLTSLLLGKELKIANEDGIEYKSGILKGALKPALMTNISFGSQDGEVGGSLQDTQRKTEGIPMAFRQDKSGNLWILDSIFNKLKCFSQKGDLVKAVSLSGLTPKDGPPIWDFAFGPENGFYILVPAEKMIKRLSSEGKELIAVEGMEDVLEINSDEKGNVLALDSVKNCVYCFKPDGVLDWQRPGITGLSLITDSLSRPYGITGDDAGVVLFKVSDNSSGKTEEIAKFELSEPAESKVTFASKKILGTDSKGNIYVELVATNDEGVVFQHRFYKIAPDGKDQSFREIQVKAFFSPDLPRHFTVLSNGTILGFSADEISYQLYSYDLAKK